MIKRFLKIVTGLGIIGFATLAGLTYAAMRPLPDDLSDFVAGQSYIQITDRHGYVLNQRYQDQWNIHDQYRLDQIPPFLITAFLMAEDQRFYHHQGIDWVARLSALVTNIRHMRAVRGASTISEQVVRMLHPRKRGVWARWVEGFEALNLEKKFTKAEILDFYLNQVPYAAHRRGVGQAAAYYFDRDLATLNRKETAALAVLVRAPSRMDLYKDTQKRAEKRIAFLMTHMVKGAKITAEQAAHILSEEISLQRPDLDISAPSFTRYALATIHPKKEITKIRTSFDGHLYQTVQKMLNARILDLKSQKIRHGGVVIVDVKTGEIRSWNSAFEHDASYDSYAIDAVRVLRQPGSALKPFLYAYALEKGWTPVTFISDTPLTEQVGHGLHQYQNYSRRYYGDVTLRQALANSLNIPALRALQFVGIGDYLDYLRELGFDQLTQHPNFYGDGIALGNGEVRLIELAQAYLTLAHHGRHKYVHFYPDFYLEKGRKTRISPASASLISDILSDAQARHLEFGTSSVLNLPTQTAIKTGTSSDYRDAWIVGYDADHLVAIWMGNMDQSVTDGVTGATGPALLLRSIFAHLNKDHKTHKLPMASELRQYDLCLPDYHLRDLNEDCQIYQTWLDPRHLPNQAQAKKDTARDEVIYLKQPSNNLHIAMDPRTPETAQEFKFIMHGVLEDDDVMWHVNDHIYHSQGGTYSWPLTKGQHQLNVTVKRAGKVIKEVSDINFIVK